ncbi:endonuclease III [Halanaerobium saccharolyticum]|uniref:Endonuclease III n=1 Tax=Halanaerobium saccharolyticum TaxID=43595 RepID=A0A2T5RK80_9FIRM|nr:MULTISPECIES: endonuclease III [Halanaerobium]PTV99296.1 DNA-(apurinic or apyrimidinic site) lyase /endonuclease III [Halanaerobium saccharolyticum]PUU94522.1 MAG: endonuclease III [Halanaerobium sp.]TDP90654.1 DNA-(apurinic or apyrimidinic site) lyase /endonuclease III [Halanaerobium saccharolyticum]
MTDKISKEEKVEKLVDLFSEHYPEPGTALNFSTPFELLIATILSAQTTDIQVNKVTEDLFQEYNTPEAMLKLSQQELEEKINSIGLFRNKAKYILKTCRILLDEFGGEVPETRKELLKLSGVGRKTANVVLANAFFKAAFPVDTHVFRVSERLGLSSGQNVSQTEKELTDLIPKKYWIDFHHWLIDHGRALCKAQNPDCENCFASNLCTYYSK